MSSFRAPSRLSNVPYLLKWPNNRATLSAAGNSSAAVLPGARPQAIFEPCRVRSV